MNYLRRPSTRLVRALVAIKRLKKANQTELMRQRRRERPSSQSKRARALRQLHWELS